VKRREMEKKRPTGCLLLEDCLDRELNLDSEIGMRLEMIDSVSDIKAER
jgi:hypothetical protein